ncbi:MAG: translation elongation factor Ts [Holosporales bacterium]|jgi:elongation factor Ts|nr:translation elongation factor Ts [Holosporales bacterium]
MEVSAKLVKELRDKTGAGMMDCKRALLESGADIETAVEYLRKKGLMDAAKKASRTAADGLIAFAISDDKTKASIIELNSETDFVAKNDKFQALACEIAKIALQCDDLSLDGILGASYTGKNNTVKEEIDSLISLVGENMSLRRSEQLTTKVDTTIAGYMHNAVSSNLGKIGVLVAIKSNSDNYNRLNEFGRRIAMHIAAANPAYLSVDEVPSSVIAKEKSIILEQAKEIGKPADIAEKMAEGRVKKFMEEIVLLEQVFVMDSKLKVREVIENFSKEISKEVSVVKFIKYVLGEGIKKTESNFAEEVMSFIK